MVIRKERKRKKYLGNRTRGAGDTKNRRGSGSKGGKGKAGKWGHRKTTFLGEIGNKSKQKPNVVDKVINLFTLNDYIQSLIMSKTINKDNIVLDFNKDPFLNKFDKIVAKGNLNYKVIIKNAKCSAKVLEQVKQKGGSFE